MRAENIGAPGGGGGPACHDAKVLHIHFEGAQVVGTRNIVKSNIFTINISEKDDGYYITRSMMLREAFIYVLTEFVR